MEETVSRKILYLLCHIFWLPMHTNNLKLHRCLITLARISRIQHSLIIHWQSKLLKDCYMLAKLVIILFSHCLKLIKLHLKITLISVRINQMKKTASFLTKILEMLLLLNIVRVDKRCSQLHCRTSKIFQV